jgi:hypothetical protein
LKAHAWKVCIRETVSRVRIPLPPPYVLVLIVVFYINSTKLRMSPGRQGQMKEAKAVDAARLQGFGGGSKPFASGAEWITAMGPRGDICPHHSITSSARRISASGGVRPRTLAVLPLITSTNLVGCSTGSSAGLAPFRTLSTNKAAPRYISASSAK